MTWMQILYSVMLYVNTAMTVAIIVIYVIAAKKASGAVRYLKSMMAFNMFVAFATYVQLALPGEFTVGIEALQVRMSYALLLVTLLVSGIAGMVGKRE